MANTRELRRRIRSVKNTAQITKAMQMVSATKMRRAQIQALGGRPYNMTLSEILSSVSGKLDLQKNPLLKPNESKKVAVLLLTSDKGLCGALNTNVLRVVQNFSSHPVLSTGSINIDSRLRGNDNLTDFYTVGKKGRDFIVRTKRNLVADFENPEKIDFKLAIQIRKMFVESFLKVEVGEVYLLYSDFKSTLRQEPKLVKLLPITVDEFRIQNAELRNSEFLFEPSPASVLDFALVHHLDTQIYQALLETKASEHSARMIAMQNATNNAKDLVTDLTLTYNQIRQNAITTELLEITSAQAALE